MDKQRVWKVTGICLLLLCGILLLSRFYRCPLYAVSGIPCPGCGMTRAFLALLRLDFAAAWNWNPAIYPLAVCAACAVICALTGHLRRVSSPLLWTAAVVLILVWAVRFPEFLQGTGFLTIRTGSVGEKILHEIFVF